MKIVYAGANALSVLPLAALREAGFQICAVLTQPDRPAGRKGTLTPCPLKEYAAAEGLPVLDFVRVRDHVAELLSVGADCMVTCSYGQILTQEVLDAFPRGVFNVHTSLLPRWRGASPIQHAILAGDAETGVTVMRTEAGLDTGDMLLQERIPIAAEDTAGTLAQKLFELGSACIVRALRAVEGGDAVFTPQDGSHATLCKKIRKEDCSVDFSEPAEKICRLVRAMNPEPLAFTRLHGKLVNLYFAAPSEGSGPCGQVLRADKRGILVAAGEGAVNLTQLQFEGGKRLAAADAVNGRKVAVGDVFGGEE